MRLKNCKKFNEFIEHLEKKYSLHLITDCL